MKKNLIVCFVAAFCLLFSTALAAVTVDMVDGVAGASKKNYYEKTSLTGEKLFEAIKSCKVAFVLSTTNPDGSPNAGVFIPGVVSDSVLKFGMAQNQTALNIKRTKQAVLTVYQLVEGESGKKNLHYGARLVLELVESEDKALHLKIKSVLPLG